MKKLFLIIGLFLFFGENYAQKKFSGEWYFDTLSHSAFDSYHKLSFQYTPSANNLSNIEEYFVTFQKFEQLDNFAQIVPKEKVRGIQLENSIGNFPVDATREILSQFPNLDIIQFSAGSLFKPFPEKNNPFPEYITELKQLKVLSFKFHVDFPLDNLSAYTKKMPQLEGLFFISLYDSIGAEVLDHPSLNSILLTSKNFRGQELPINPRVKNVGLLSARNDRNVNHSMEQMKAFPNLENLYLDHARFEGQRYFEHVKGVRKLEINNLDSLTNTDFYQELSTLKHLKQLDIFNDKDTLQNIAIIGKLTQIKRLSLSNIASLNEIEFLHNFKNLEILHLARSNVTLERLQFSTFKNLKKLSLVSLPKLNLSPNTFQNEKLEKLYMIDNEMSEVPSLNSLSNLKVLDLSNNSLTSFNHQHLRLPDLEILRLNNNSLVALSLNLSSLPKLNRLEAQKNVIQEITGPIPSHSSLQHINLEGNRLSQIALSFENLETLTFLNLNYNSLNRLPPGLKSLQILMAMNQKVYIDGDNEGRSTLTHLSKDFETYSQLERIQLRGNKNLILDPLWILLKETPPKHPFFLDLRDIGYVTLPEGDFWNSIDWTYLDLTENIIPKLPKSWARGLKFNWVGLGKIESFPKSPSNFMFNSKTDFQVFLDAHGYSVDLDDLNDDQYIAGIENLMNKYSSSKAPEIIFGFYNKAYSRNPSLTQQKLQISSLGKAAFENENYEVALPIILNELKKESESSFRFINSITDLIEKLEKIYLSNGNEKSLVDLWLETAVEFNQLSNFTKAALRIWDDNKPKADSLLNLGLIAHEKNMDWNVSNNRQDIGMTLDYLEVALIAGDDYHQEKAKKLFSTWSDTADDNRKRIFKYLDGMITISNGNQPPLQSEEKIQGWNFGLIQQWIALIKDPNLKNTLSDWHDNHAKQ